MQQLLDPIQMRAADKHTIQQQQITENELIDRAAGAFVREFIAEYPELHTSIAVYCGPGNNGADGLMIAGLLHQMGYLKLEVYLCCFGATPGPAFLAKQEWLSQLSLKVISLGEGLVQFSGHEQVSIEALFGSGLNKPLQGEWLNLVKQINGLGSKVVAVDIPAGLPAVGIINPADELIHADLVIGFQRPVLNFFFPESIVGVSRFKVVDIGLDEIFIQAQSGAFHLVTREAVEERMKPRKRFSHKGDYGHALLIAGHEDTMGAALLAASACLYAGAGLTTAAIPAAGLVAMNTSLPEVMYLNVDRLGKRDAFKPYNAIGAGPGLGNADMTLDIVKMLFETGKPLVLDADALNVLAENQRLFKNIPAGTILTPHMKEFDRLFGAHESWWERVETARAWAKQSRAIVVLKNQYTFIIDQEGKVYINTTGNPGMAQGGMGDVLTGIVLSMLAQGYTALDAALIACYLHGKSGDLLAADRAVIRAADLAAGIPEVLKF